MRTNWYDETPRDEMCRCLIEELNLAMKDRDNEGGEAPITVTSVDGVLRPVRRKQEES